MDGARVADELRKLIGTDHVGAGVHDLITYSSDMYPRHQVLKLGRETPPVSPLAVCFPRTAEEVARVLQFCRAERLPAIAYGGGSGVCGATVPEEPCVILDMKGMDRILEFSPGNGTVTVEPGIIGERLEDWLSFRGFTLGHFPSSIACSTVGGYVACRSAGQYSSRYGKIEDMTLGLEGVTPAGETVRFGTLGGGHHRDPMLAAVLGSEGTLLIVTRVCLKVERVPAQTDFRGFAFPEVEDGLRCMRRIMHTPLKPTVLRLYDPLDSLIAGHGGTTASGQDLHAAAARLTGLKALLGSALSDLNHKGLALLLYKPGLLNRVAELVPSRPLLVAGVQGTRTAVSRQWDRIAAAAGRCRGEDLGPGPGYAWLKRRYAVSYKQSRVFAAGAFVDTMEVATTWDRVHPLYKAMLKAVGPHVFISAHFSHAYVEGCAIYFTFAGYRPSMQSSLNLYHRVWKLALETAARLGATVSHHHSAGLLKRAFMDRETPGAAELFSAFKTALDPANVLNPGKLFSLENGQGQRKNDR